MGDELSCSPYQGTTSIYLEDPDSGAKSSAAEESPRSGAFVLGQRKNPSAWLVTPR